MRVGVVGGSGFVGRHVVRHLADAGATVLNVDVSAPREALPDEAVVLADLARTDAVERAAAACQQLDSVVWLAATIAAPPITDEGAATQFTLGVQAPVTFLGSLPSLPQSTVFASSVDVYGAPERQPIDESHPTNPHTVYGAGKLAGEHYLRIMLRDTDCSLASLRLAYVYGPGQHPSNAIPRFLDALRAGSPPRLRGDGKERRDDVFVGDVAKAVGLASEQCADGVFNVASGSPHTLIEVAETVCAVSGTALRPSVGDEPTTWTDRSFDVRRSRDQLGFEATTTLADGLRAMWDDIR